MDRPIPPHFAQTIHDLYGASGTAWLAALPQLIAAVEARWNIRVGQAFGLSYNYVAGAESADGVPLVLKLRVPHDAPWSELAALRHYAGHGCAQLLAADETLGAMLI